jgi:hypothetical protein
MKAKYPVIVCVVAILGVITVLSFRVARADTIVGNGTPQSCTESALNAAIASGGTITFNCGGSFTFHITSIKRIVGTTTIDGRSQVAPYDPQITIDGDQAISVFEVPAGTTLTIRGLTVTRGKAAGIGGGGILNRGTLNIRDQSAIFNNQSDTFGGGIASEGGSVTIEDSTISGNTATQEGGGLRLNYVLDVNIIRSKIEGNTTGGTFSGGGGIRSYNSNIIIEDSSLWGNKAFAGNGAAINANGGTEGLTIKRSVLANNTLVGPNSKGGAIYSSGTEVKIVNTTLAQNDASAAGSNGGAIYATGSAGINLINATVATNQSSGTTLFIDSSSGAYMDLTNTVVVGESAKGTCNTPISDNGYSLQYPDLSCGEPIRKGNPNLMGLQANGTMPLQAGSAAINGADPSCGGPDVSNVDQRGTQRSGNGFACDIGAYETTSPILYSGRVVNSPDDPASGTDYTCDSNCTLRDAITTAPAGDTIFFAYYVRGTITLTSAISFAKSLTITGPGADQLAISGGNAVPIFRVNDSYNSNVVIKLSISNLTFKNGRDSSPIGSAQGGGAIKIYSYPANSFLTLANSIFSHNDSVNGSGGAVQGILPTTIINTQFSDNHGASGGAIAASNSPVTIQSSSFINNHVEGDGGAVVAGVATVTGSTFSANVSGGDGGAVWASGGSIFINDTFVGNSAGYRGGALYVNSLYGKIWITNDTFSGNSAGFEGNSVESAWYCSFGDCPKDVTFTNTIIVNNTPGYFECYGAIVDGGNNLQQFVTTWGCVGTVTDPKLDPLGNYGGPTQTMRLQPNSPAIDAIPVGQCKDAYNPPLTTDQRGFVRPVSGGTGNVKCDIGAFEANSYNAAIRDTIGVFRPGSQQFLLRNSNTTGPADIYVTYGTSTDFPITGDWNGDGVDTVGIYNSTNGLFSLRDSNAVGAPTVYSFVLGSSGDRPIAGDWDADGRDGVGVFRPSNGLIYLKNSLTSGAADFTMVLGSPGDVGLAGDWNGDGKDSPGVYRPNMPMFFLTNQVCNCGVVADYSVTLGVVGDVPVIGDWDGDVISGIGVFRPTTGLMFLRNDPTTSGVADIQFVYGVANDKPVAGHWVAGAPSISNPVQSTPVLAPTFVPTKPNLAPTFVPRK